MDSPPTRPELAGALPLRRPDRARLAGAMVGALLAGSAEGEPAAGRTVMLSNAVWRVTLADTRLAGNEARFVPAGRILAVDDRRTGRAWVYDARRHPGHDTPFHGMPDEFEQVVPLDGVQDCGTTNRLLRIGVGIMRGVRADVDSWDGLRLETAPRPSRELRSLGRRAAADAVGPTTTPEGWTHGAETLI